MKIAARLSSDMSFKTLKSTPMASDITLSNSLAVILVLAVAYVMMQKKSQRGYELDSHLIFFLFFVVDGRGLL